MNKRRKSLFSFSPRFILLFLISSVIAFPILSQGVDMFGWFKKQEVFLSSEVNGVVTENGEPVANLKVTRALMYIDGKEHIDVATTNNVGQFSFPQKSIRSSIPSKPFSEDRVSQEIYIDRDGALIPFWVATHVGITEIPEFTKKLFLLKCELNNKRVSFAFKNNNNKHLDYMASSICRWEEDYIATWLHIDKETKYRIHDGDFNKLTEQGTGREINL